jgi:hypothetical protein
MTPHADLSDPIPTATDEPAPPGAAPPTAGLPDFLTVVEAARLLRIGRTSAYLLAQQWLYSDGREGLPVVRVGRQLRVPRRALERLAGGELTLVPAQSPASAPVTAPSVQSTRALTDDNTWTRATRRTLDRSSTAKPRAGDRDTRGTQAPLFATDR